MILCVLNIISFLLGIAVTIGILNLILGYERKEKSIWFIVAFCVVFLLNLGANIFIKDAYTSGLISEVLSFSAIMFLPYFLLKSERKFSFFFFGVIVCSTVDYFESLLSFFIKKSSVVNSQIIYIAIYTVLLALILLMSRRLKNRISPSFFESLSPVLGIVIFLADYAVYYDMMLSKDSTYYIEGSVAIKTISASVLVGCFSYIVYLCSKYLYKQKETEIQLQAELKHYEETVKKNEAIRMFKHDYKNNLYSIKMLASDGRNDEVVKFIDGLNNEIKISDNKYKTGNFLADAIISEKATQAEKANIQIEFSGVIPNKGIENNDICTIISNALDNAITACVEIAPCKIKIHSEITSNGMIISFENPVKNNVKIKNNNIKSTKNDSKNHGFGILNIKKAVKKYDGFVELKCDNNLFSLDAGLAIKN